MRGIHQTTGTRNVFLSESGHEITHALNLGHNMTHALLHHLARQRVHRLFERLERIVGTRNAIGSHSQIGHA